MAAGGAAPRPPLSRFPLKVEPAFLLPPPSVLCTKTCSPTSGQMSVCFRRVWNPSVIFAATRRLCRRRVFELSCFHRGALSVRGHGFASLCGSRRSRRFSHSCSSVTGSLRLPQLHRELGLSFNSSSACETLIAGFTSVQRPSARVRLAWAVQPDSPTTEKLPQCKPEIHRCFQEPDI